MTGCFGRTASGDLMGGRAFGRSTKGRAPRTGRILSSSKNRLLGETTTMASHDWRRVVNEGARLRPLLGPYFAPTSEAGPAWIELPNEAFDDLRIFLRALGSIDPSPGPVGYDPREVPVRKSCQRWSAVTAPVRDRLVDAFEHSRGDEQGHRIGFRREEQVAVARMLDEFARYGTPGKPGALRPPPPPVPVPDPLPPQNAPDASRTPKPAANALHPDEAVLLAEMADLDLSDAQLNKLRPEHAQAIRMERWRREQQDRCFELNVEKQQQQIAHEVALARSRGDHEAANRLLGQWEQLEKQMETIAVRRSQEDAETKAKQAEEERQAQEKALAEETSRREDERRVRAEVRREMEEAEEATNRQARWRRAHRVSRRPCAQLVFSLKLGPSVRTDAAERLLARVVVRASTTVTVPTSTTTELHPRRHGPKGGTARTGTGTISTLTGTTRTTTWTTTITLRTTTLTTRQVIETTATLMP